ncbi:MAG: aminoacyl-histidine dipeptidase, partial [Acidobacteriota bacterium]|jgi:dipeptidase D
VVRKPASPGHENAPAVALQSHLDMVPEKNSDVDFDFTKDAIRPERGDGDYLTAQGTTLGSDNGIGVAAMLAVLDADDLELPPIECLFTIDEETGLVGAGNLGPGLLNAKRLLNLDSEEEGSVYVGCAGGVNSRITVPAQSEAVDGDSVALAVKVFGFKGGHSGVDIHLQRANAVKALVRAVHAAAVDHPVRFATLAGGSAHNAIPREAEATIVCPASAKDAVEKAIRDEMAAVAAENRPEPGVSVDVTAVDAPDRAWDAASSARILDLLVGLPHGVLAMSHDIPDLVETSANLATVGVADGGLDALVSIRSSVDSAKWAEARRVQALAQLAGGATELEGDYPGWNPNMDSELLGVVKEVHESELGAAPEIKAIHAGLETGIIGQKYPGMDMISFGPQIEFPHSPDERVLIPSVGRFWTLLTGVLKKLA